VHPRDERLLDAAIEVLGTSGMRNLTHRAVDAAAGVPLGSTSNRFRTRAALLVGVLRRILELEVATWTKLAKHLRITSIETLAAALGRLVEEQTEAGRTVTQARRAIFVEAANNPILRNEIIAGQHDLASWLAPMLASLGSTDPPAHVRHLLALLEGLLGHRLATGAPDLEPAPAIAALLHGLIDPGPR
jgi:AcrR family transcriptional regulator